MRAMFLEMQNCSICSSLRIFPSQVLNFCTTIFKESIISNNSFLSLSIKQSNAFIILGFLLLIEYYQITKLQISFKKSQNSNEYTYEKRLKPKFYLHLHLDLMIKRLGPRRSFSGISLSTSCLCESQQSDAASFYLGSAAHRYL